MIDGVFRLEFPEEHFRILPGLDSEAEMVSTEELDRRWRIMAGPPEGWTDWETPDFRWEKRYNDDGRRPDFCYDGFVGKMAIFGHVLERPEARAALEACCHLFPVRIEVREAFIPRCRQRDNAPLDMSASKPRKEPYDDRFAITDPVFRRRFVYDKWLFSVNDDEDIYTAGTGSGTFIEYYRTNGLTGLEFCPMGTSDA